jgi:hypothetical protein
MFLVFDFFLECFLNYELDLTGLNWRFFGNGLELVLFFSPKINTYVCNIRALNFGFLLLHVMVLFFLVFFSLQVVEFLYDLTIDLLPRFTLVLILSLWALLRSLVIKGLISLFTLLLTELVRVLVSILIWLAASHDQTCRILRVVTVIRLLRHCRLCHLRLVMMEYRPYLGLHLRHWGRRHWNISWYKWH